jgi:adenosylhomocysteine nucleosidase
VKILVTFAVDAEFGPWRKRHKFTRTRVGNMNCFSGTVGGIEADVLITGIGSRSESSAMAFFIMQSAPGQEYDACVSSGLTGALRSGHVIGEILAASRVIVKANSRESASTNGITANEALLRWAGECGATIGGPFLTVDHIVATVAEKLDLSGMAQAVEMESYHVLQAACVFGVRRIAIRAVSDLATEELPLDLGLLVDERGTVKIGAVVRQVLRRPMAIPALVRLGWNSQKSARSLARFLDKYFEKMSAFRLQVDASRVPIGTTT